MMNQDQSFSPETSIFNNPLDDVSDLSFERMEQICELMDKEELKDKLPTFSNEQEETEYILSIEDYYKNAKKDVGLESFSEGISVIDEIDSSDSSCSDQQEVLEIQDTLEEVNFILALGNQGISTPKCSKRYSNNHLKIPATDSRLEKLDIRNITFRKKQLPSSIPRYQHDQLNRSLNLSPSCRTQAAVSHSPLLSPFQY